MGSTTTSKLEVIEKGGVAAGPTLFHLLFVHGAFQAAWYWDENFLDFFAGHGYRAIAFSLAVTDRAQAQNPSAAAPSPTTSSATSSRSV
jgi:pimeloyl-ACP methyl ester carboxylesterase